MPSLIHAVAGAAGAVVFWTVIGYALSRRLAPAIALPIAPALGWAVHSAVALPVFGLVGLTPVSVTLISAAVVLAAVAFILSESAADADKHVGVPIAAYGVAALCAVGPAIAVAPKISADAVTLAAAIFDHTKIAMIDEMMRSGVPAQNPFFAAPGSEAPLSYYYLWHFSAAELALSFGLSAWEADLALSGFTAFSSLTLMMGFAVLIGGRAAAALWVAPLALAASLRPVLEWAIGPDALYAILLPPSGLAGWLFQTAWAPQHVASAMCVVLAGFLIAVMARRAGALSAFTLALVAAAAYQSSAWVGGIVFAIAASAIALIALADPRADRARFAAWSIAAALMALTLSYPFLRDQIANAAARGAAAPIAFSPSEVFGAGVPDALRRSLDLPGFWFGLLAIEFPAIYIPGIVSLAHHLRTEALDRVRFISKAFAAVALSGLLVAAFLTSTLADNNDLGWRSVLPAVMVLAIFAAAGLARWLAAGARVMAGVTLLLLAAALPDTVRIVAEHVRGAPSAVDRAFAQTPQMWEAVRRQTGPAARVGSNPLFLAEMTPWPGNVSWALLSNRRSCFAGRELVLPFAPLPRAEVERIAEQFRSVFAGETDADAFRDWTIRFDCTTVIVTPADGAWRRDPFAASADYVLVDFRPERWRIYRKVSRNVAP